MTVVCGQKDRASREELVRAIREELARGGDDAEIAVRAGTTAMAVRVVRKGLGRCGSAASGPQAWQPQALRTEAPAAGVPGARGPAAGCPWTGRFAVVDGSNVAGWGRPRGQPRLAQPLAAVRYLQANGVRCICLFDANFRWALKRRLPHDADVLDRLLQDEPEVFKQSPAGAGPDGKPIKADVFILREAAAEPDGLVITNDLYRAETGADSDAFGWVAREPARFIRGICGAKGDLLLGASGEVRIPVAGDPASYLS